MGARVIAQARSQKKTHALADTDGLAIGDGRSVEQQLAAMLDSKFLVTKPMADFFAEPGVLDQLLTFVTRTRKWH